MSFIDNIPDNAIREFAKAQFEKVQRRDEQIAHLQSQVSSLKSELGEVEQFEDTPSLNIIYFRNSRPFCEEHGAMNCYEHQIYRCIMCGVAVSLQDVKVVKT